MKPNLEGVRAPRRVALAFDYLAALFLLDVCAGVGMAVHALRQTDGSGDAALLLAGTLISSGLVGVLVGVTLATFFRWLAAMYLATAGTRDEPAAPAVPLTAAAPGPPSA